MMDYASATDEPEFDYGGECSGEDSTLYRRANRSKHKKEVDQIANDFLDDLGVEMGMGVRGANRRISFNEEREKIENRRKDGNKFGQMDHDSMNLGRKSLYEAVMEAEMTDDSDNEENMQYPMERLAMLEEVKQKKDRITTVAKPDEKMEQRMSQNLDSLVD